METDFEEQLKTDIALRLNNVTESINRACKEAGRDASEVTLVGVSKVFPVGYAEAAFLSGLKDLGENRVQELLPKEERMGELGLKPNWHLIGTLQKNKVKYIIGKTHLIHSVDSVELASEISKRSVSAGIVTDILLQGNISGEESKHGFSEEELRSSMDILNSLEGIRIRGLMTMAPIQTYEGEARITFSKTRSVFDGMKRYVKDPSIWDILSMGMSQDYPHAIAEGSTMVRIGTAIFGDRKSYNA